MAPPKKTEVTVHENAAEAPALPDGIPVVGAAFPKDWPFQPLGEPLTSIRCEGKATDTAGVESAWLPVPGVLAVRYRGEVYVRAGGFTARLARS